MTNNGILAPPLTSIDRKIPRNFASQLGRCVMRLIRVPMNNRMTAMIRLIIPHKAMNANVLPRRPPINDDTLLSLNKDLLQSQEAESWETGT